MADQGPEDRSISAGEFKRGWPIVASAAVGIGLGLSPLPFYTIGVFIRPLSAEFGWSVDKILTALLAMTLTVVAMGPVVGWLADRFGARRVALVSIGLFALSLALFAASNGSLTLFYANWVLMGLAGAGTLPITWTRGVNAWFVRNRGLALGCALVATGLFGSLAKLYANALIETLGWRAAYLGLAALPALVALPIAFFFFRDTPRNGAPSDSAARAAAPAQPGLSFAQAVRHWRFWVLAAAFVPISLALGGPIPNLETILGAKGFARGQAVELASLVGYAVMVGRVGGGWLIDRFWAPGVAFVLLASPALALYALAQPGALGFPVAAAAIAMLGIALGVEYDFMAYMSARYFGLRSYGSIYGALYGFFALGAGVGPVWYGRAFVAEGNYDGVLMIGAGLTVLGALLLLTLGRYPTFAQAGIGSTTSNSVPSGPRSVAARPPP